MVHQPIETVSWLLPNEGGKDFEHEWSQIMVRTTIAFLKYSQTRCNVNNMIWDAYYGEYAVYTIAIVS